MENSFQTSFIPKKPVTANYSSNNVRPPTSIFTALAFILLIIVVASAGGLFLYKNYLTKQKEILSSSLELVKNSFEKDTLDELELYDKRVSAAKNVLSKHIVLSPLFALLGSLTLPSIQYTNFSEQSSSQGFSVKLSGSSLDYKSIALQADAFNSAKGRLFKNVVFSDINKLKNNNVNFNIEFIVDPILLSYEKNLSLEQAQSSKSKSEVTPTNKISTPSDNLVIPTDNSINPSPDPSTINNKSQ